MPLLVLDVLRHDVEQPGDALALQTAHLIQLDSTAQWAAAPVAVIRFAGLRQAAQMHDSLHQEPVADKRHVAGQVLHAHSHLLPFLHSIVEHSTLVHRAAPGSSGTRSS